MVSIAIVPLPEPGHINQTLCLSRQLTELGHQVTYITTEESANLFRERGLPVVLAKQRPYTDISEIGFELDFEPDVALVDSSIPYVSLWAWEQGWRVINLSVLYPRRYDPSVPPLGTPLVPSDVEGERERIRAAWDTEHRVNVERRSVHVRRRAEAAGLSAEWVDERAALGAFLRFPEIILGAEELDFKRQQRDDLFYAGPGVDLSRKEQEYPFEQLPQGRPIIYCSFGTQLHRYKQLAERWRMMMGAARELPEAHFVVAAGRDYSGDVPPNVSVVSDAPQLGMLRRARLMVSHGGMNGVHEALCLGVPVLVLPFDLDQPGNAARVEHGGFGRKLSWDDAGPASISATLRAMLTEPALAERVRGLSEVLRAALREGRAGQAFTQCWTRYQEGRSMHRRARS